MDTNAAPDSGPEPVAVPVSDTTALSARDAANALLDWRRKDAAKEAEAPSPAAEPQEKEIPPEADAAPAEEATGEQTQAPEPEIPPIEPPRSWTKEEKEEFASYPREAQEKIARREQDRETALRRGQNETAEQRKAIEAERQRLEQARQQYEQTLPQLLEAVRSAQAGEFADIKTQADVNKLAAEDWPRFAKYQAHLMNVATIEHETKQAQERQQKEYSERWSQFAAKEDALFLEKAPDMADDVTRKRVANISLRYLKDQGFSDDDLGKAWNGQASVSLRDHRVQAMIRDAALYREAQKSVSKKVAAKPVPPVQRPGIGETRMSSDEQEIKSLEKRFQQTGNWKDGAALLNARRGIR